MNNRTDTVGKRMRDLRKARGWSQDEVARKVDVRPLAVGKWERNEANPSTKNLIALARLYGVDPRELGYEPPVWTPETPPEWAERYHQELLTAINALNASVEAIKMRTERP